MISWIIAQKRGELWAAYCSRGLTYHNVIPSCGHKAAHGHSSNISLHRPAQCCTVPARLHSWSQFQYVTAPTSAVLHSAGTAAQRPHITAQGQHITGQGQYLTAQGQHTAAHGQHITAPGQQNMRYLWVSEPNKRDLPNKRKRNQISDKSAESFTK